jgi:hypothetical protein
MSPNFALILPHNYMRLFLRMKIAAHYNRHRQTLAGLARPKTNISITSGSYSVVFAALVNFTSLTRG